jgi:hypothetical protein
MSIMKKIIQYCLLSFGIALMLVSCIKSESAMIDSGYNGTPTGKAGSMAKFSISNDHLFLINDSALLVFDVSNETNPVQVSKLNVDFGIETVFTLGEKLFIGSTTGVYIYDIENPSNIIFLSKYEHITSCDPVVANDSLAFATLNSQSTCRWQNGANQLDVIDITNSVYPQLISSFPMQNPKGLGIDDTLLFVCNSGEGVKIFDFSDPKNLKQVSGILGVDAYDLILRDKILFLVGKDGLFQYDYENINQITVLSNIPF